MLTGAGHEERDAALRASTFELHSLGPGGPTNPQLGIPSSAPPAAVSEPDGSRRSGGRAAAAADVLVAFYAEGHAKVVAAMALVESDAREAVDEAVAHAWRHGVADGDRETFVSYVRSRALVVARRARRERRRERQTWRHTHAVADHTFGAIDDAIVFDVRSALATLSCRQREVVVLHYMLDQPIEQVARELGISQSTVKTMLARARALLRYRLDRAGADASGEP